jgi:hypothetical protein
MSTDTLSSPNSNTTSSSSSLSNITPTAQLGGARKKNGHKAACKCPICQNMMHSKKGGSYLNNNSTSNNYSKVIGHKALDTTNVVKKGGKRKGNGHKPNCGCPICKNMRKSRGGGDIEEGETGEESWDIEMGSPDNEPEEVVEATVDDYDIAEKGEAGVDSKVGGTRRRKSRRSKGRKTHRKRNTRRNKKRSHRRN